jgi:hypothetical protein
LATLMLKVGSETDVWPSLTLTVMLPVCPTFALRGVPVIVPVVVLKLAQLGLLVIENVRRSPSGSIALGVKL